MTLLPQSVLNALPVGVALLRRDLTVYAWNAALHDWTGIADAEIVGHALVEFFPHWQSPVLASRLEQVFATGAPAVFSAQLHGELFPPPGNASQRKQHVTVTLLHSSAADQPLALVTVEDVTELSNRIDLFRSANQRLKAEIEARAQAEQALRLSERRYRAISELSMDFALSLVEDEAGVLRVEWVTDAFELITGFDRASLHTAAELSALVHPDDLAAMSDAMQLALRDGQPREVDHRMLTAAGAERFVWTKLRGSREDGRGRLTLICRDVTELKAARERAFELELEQERTRLLASFIQNMSHDLRTPLAEVSAALFALGREDSLAARLQSVDRLQGQILQVGHLLDEINEMTEFDSAHHLQLAEMDVNHVLIMLTDSLRNTSSERRVRLATEFARELPRVRGEQRALLRAFTAVIENALRFAPERSTVSVRSCVAGNEVVVEVADQGPGIPEEQLAHIFERFHKTNNARTADGSGAGLGLAMVKRIMELHGGSVDVQSASGRGSIFRLHLPALPPRTAAPPRPRLNLAQAHTAAHALLREKKS